MGLDSPGIDWNSWILGWHVFRLQTLVRQTVTKLQLIDIVNSDSGNCLVAARIAQSETVDYKDKVLHFELDAVVHHSFWQRLGNRWRPWQLNGHPVSKNLFLKLWMSFLYFQYALVRFSHSFTACLGLTANNVQRKWLESFMSYASILGFGVWVATPDFGMESCRGRGFSAIGPT